MTVLLTMKPAEYGCNLQWFPNSPQLAISRSDVICVVTRMNCGVRPPESPNRVKSIGCSSRERTTADVCLK